MNKTSTRILIYALLVVVFNVIFFLVGGTEHSTTGWVAYGFMYVALIVSFIAPLLCINYKRIPENLVTIYGFAWAYSIISIILNSIFILLDFAKTTWCIAMNIILLAVYIIQLIINMAINKQVEQRLENTDSERKYVHSLSGILKLAMDSVSDLQSKKVLEKAYDIVRTSPINSNESVMDIELEVTRLVNTLYDNLSSLSQEEISNRAEQIVKLAEKRNMLLR